MTNSVYGFDDAVRRIRALPGALDRARREGLVDAALIVERRAKENIQQGRSEWPPLAKSTLKSRRAARGRTGTAKIQPLYAEGTLLRSIDHEVDEEQAVIGPTVRYGMAHEDGAKKAGRSKNVTIPKRAYLAPAVEEGMDEMAEAFRERVARAVRG